MSSEFDVTLVSDEAVAPEVVAEHLRTVEHLAQRPSALANAKLHADNELQRLIIVCNRLVWGAVPTELRAPTGQEVAELFGRLAPDDREKLSRDARLATTQRHLVGLMADAQAHYHAQLEAEKSEMAARAATAREWAEFEAYDSAGKEQRFAVWKSARSA
jgi:hypothetical protein